MLRERDYGLNFYTGLISIGLVLFLLGFFALISLSGQIVVKEAKEDLELKLMLLPGTNSADGKSLAEKIKRLWFVKSSRYVSQDQALNELHDLGEEFKKEVIGDLSSYFSSVNIKLKEEVTHPDTIREIMRQLSKLDYVREVHYPVHLIELVNARSASFAMISLSLGGLLVFIAYLLIMNTIRLDIYSKRLMIRTMQLIGATSTYIRKPFLMLGVFQGFFGACIAIIFLFVVLIVISFFITNLEIILTSKELVWICIFLVVFGSVLGYFSSLIAVNKYLDKSLEEII